MSWRDKYRPASFRGARFWVEAHDASGGRRVVVHEYVGRDEPTVEDLGGMAEGCSITAYVATTPGNDDYMVERDAFLAALRQKGPGEMVHPYLGAMRVQIMPWRFSESKDHGGMAVFDLTFVKVGASPSPSVVRSPAAGMRAASSAAMTRAKQNFAERFCLKGKPDFLRDEASGVLKDLGNLYLNVGRLAGVANQVSALVYDIEDAVNDPFAGVDALAMAERIVALPLAVSAAFEAPWRKYRNIDGTYRTGSSTRSGPLDEAVTTSLLRTMNFAIDQPEVKYATATRRQQLANQSAIGELARQSALIEAARVAPFVNWRTLEDAEAVRDRIADALDMEMELTRDDDLYRGLAGLRVLVMKSVPPEGAQLPFLVEREICRTMPALCLSYDLYETLDRADEIVALNHVVHPGFIPGMEPLKVLANV